MVNKSYKFKFNLTGLTDQQKRYLTDDIKEYEVVGINLTDAYNKFLYTVKRSCGGGVNINIFPKQENKRGKLYPQIKDVDFDYLFNNYGSSYYEVFEGSEFVKGFSGLSDAYYCMNRIGENAWIYDKNDTPYNAIAVFGDKL